MYKVSRYTAEDKIEWDRFIATAKNATFLFQRDFMDYHQDRFEDFSLMIYKMKNYMHCFRQIKKTR